MAPGLSTFERLAEPVFALADKIAAARGGAPAEAARAAADHLRRFATLAEQAGEAPPAIAAARYGLAVVLDAAVRRNSSMDHNTWIAAASADAFDGRGADFNRLKTILQKAENQGRAYEDLAYFLHLCVERVERARVGPSQSSGGGVLLVVLAVLGLAFLGGGGWAGWVEWQHRNECLARLDPLEAPLDAAATGGAVDQLAAGLDDFARVVQDLAEDCATTPIGLPELLPIGSSADAGMARYRAVAARVVPPVLHQAITQALAREGLGRELYDSLRAYDILTGRADWQGQHLIGWAQDRPTMVPGLGALAPHAGALSGPMENATPLDAQIENEARSLAAEVPEAERVYLEVLRSADAAALTPWVPVTEVPGLDLVSFRRSGRALDDPIPGLFTAAGWDWASDLGIGPAVRTARAVAETTFSVPARQENGTPDAALALLQGETIRQWEAFLADLRVRPFTDRDASLRISGRLGRSNSPLHGLLRGVWAEAGGRDRTRSHANQLSLATAFQPMIQYVDDGNLDQISRLFAALNVALVALKPGEEQSLERLMSVRDRVNSIAALRVAPRIVVQIVEDVLAQSSSALDGGTNPLALVWRRQVFPACRAAINGRFPFEDGPDVDLDAFLDVLGPGGVIETFYRERLATALDTDSEPWRWKPEARFSGLSPESAEFFQRAAEIRVAFFPGDVFGGPVTVAAIAQRGDASMQIGGQGLRMRTTEPPTTISWPGPNAPLGMSAQFRLNEQEESVSAEGPWGLLRFTDPLRLRPRDDGARYLVDLRAGQARLFFELTFEGPLNPLSARPLLKGLICPDRL